MVSINQHGAEQVARKFERMGDRAATETPKLLDKTAKQVTLDARNLAIMKGLYKTGAGVAGIDWEWGSYFSRIVGWGPRPHLHLFFHEVGTYKDPPRPHVRPAAQAREGWMARNFKDTLFRV